MNLFVEIDNADPDAYFGYWRNTKNMIDLLCRWSICPKAWHAAGIDIIFADLEELGPEDRDLLACEGTITPAARDISSISMYEFESDVIGAALWILNYGIGMFVKSQEALMAADHAGERISDRLRGTMGLNSDMVMFFTQWRLWFGRLCELIERELPEGIAGVASSAA
jgi:hypothetical protein